MKTDKLEAMGKKITTLLEKFVQQLTKEIEGMQAADKPKKAKAEKKPAKAKKGERAKVSMTCRAKGCRKKSKGPRFSFMCEEHIGQAPKKTKKNSVAKAAPAAEAAAEA